MVCIQPIDCNVKHSIFQSIKASCICTTNVQTAPENQLYSQCMRPATLSFVLIAI